MLSFVKNPRAFWALWTTLLFLLLVWGVFWTNELYDLGWRSYGNRPRLQEGLIGILTFPFLHSDFDHLWNNTATFFVLNVLLFYFYHQIAGRIWVLLYLLSGGFLWVFAEGGNHIGASGLIYGLAAFLFVSGLIRRHRILLRVSLAVVFLYGGMVWWLLPIEEHISWEGHLSGAGAGLLLAILFQNKGPKPETFESDVETPDEEMPEWWMRMEAEKSNRVDHPTPDALSPDPLRPLWHETPTQSGGIRYRVIREQQPPRKSRPSDKADDPKETSETPLDSKDPESE